MYYVLFILCVWVSMCHSKPVVVREQLAAFSFYSMALELNSGPQACQQMPVPSELPPQLQHGVCRITMIKYLTHNGNPM